MNERVLRVLEFTKIRALLSSYALSDTGKALCLELKPLREIDDIEKAQAETEALASAIDLGKTVLAHQGDGFRLENAMVVEFSAVDQHLAELGVVLDGTI